MKFVKLANQLISVTLFPPGHQFSFQIQWWSLAVETSQTAGCVPVTSRLEGNLALSWTLPLTDSKSAFNGVKLNNRTSVQLPLPLCLLTSLKNNTVRLHVNNPDKHTIGNAHHYGLINHSMQTLQISHPANAKSILSISGLKLKPVSLATINRLYFAL